LGTTFNLGDSFREGKGEEGGGPFSHQNFKGASKRLGLKGILKPLFKKGFGKEFGDEREGIISPLKKTLLNLGIYPPQRGPFLVGALSLHYFGRV